MTQISVEDVRSVRIEEERKHLLSEAGFLDFVRQCGAAPDAEWEPHGLGAAKILKWSPYKVDSSGRTLFKKKMVLWPRGTFKSQVFTVGLSAWLIARDPDVRVFIASETDHQAKKFLTNAAKIIESPWYEERFGKHRGDEMWSLTSGIVSVLRTKKHLKDPTLAAFGAGQTQTGAHWDFGIIDDPISTKNTKTKESRLSVELWIGELLAQLDPGSRLLYIGTLHHFDDYAAHQIKKKSPEWEISREEWISEEGKLFFPARLTKEFVESQRDGMETRQFFSYYHNKPMGDEQQIFRPEYFRVIRDDEVPRTTWTYIFTDFAFSALEQSDRTAFWLVSVDANRYAYVRDVVVMREKPATTVDVLFKMWDDGYSAGLDMKGIAIESTTHQELLVGLMEEMRRETFVRPRVIVVKGRSDATKMMRIHGVEPRFRDGRIYFLNSFRQAMSRWRPMFEEMTEWPLTECDDIPDSISDIDQKDPSGKFLFPGPPSGWVPAPTRTVRPTTISGRYNPDADYDPRKLARRLQDRVASDPLWTANRGEPVHNDLLRKSGTLSSLLKRP